MSEPTLRPTARVVLVDDRTGCCCNVLHTACPFHTWFTPGGGLDHGATLDQAAARELRDEIGSTGRGGVVPLKRGESPTPNAALPASGPRAMPGDGT
jgi:ADP-ribose pyrophosphatase YjhB (NUDIX family)